MADVVILFREGAVINFTTVTTTDRQPASMLMRCSVNSLYANWLISSSGWEAELDVNPLWKGLYLFYIYIYLYKNGYCLDYKTSK